jgi:hypothetical protein
MRKTLFLMGGISLLSACQNTSPPPPVTVATAPYEHQSVPDIFNVTFMARDMLYPNDRFSSEIFSELSSVDRASFVHDLPEGQKAATSSGSDLGSQAAGIGVAAGLGKSPLTLSGGATAGYAGLGFGVASALLGSHEHPAKMAGENGFDVAGGVFFPKQVGDRDLPTLDAVTRYAFEETRQNLERYVQMTGRKVSCLAICDGSRPATYEISKIDGGKTFSYYDPPAMYVTIYIKPITNVMPWENKVRDNALGFPGAWESERPTSFMICLNDQRPDPAAMAQEDDPFKTKKCNAPYAHPLERLLLRTMTDSGHFYFGYWPKGVFAWRGRVFSLGGRSPKTLIAYEIPVAVDLP